jgi:hypothetical protein
MFLYAPDTEAPEEMHTWTPELKALTCAENANHSLHNIQTLRGARAHQATARRQVTVYQVCCGQQGEDTDGRCSVSCGGIHDRSLGDQPASSTVRRSFFSIAERASVL